MASQAYTTAVRAGSSHQTGAVLRPGLESLGASAAGLARKLRRLAGNRMLLTTVVTLTPTIAITVAALLLREQLAGASEVGYLGVFFGNLVASGSVLLPVPGLAAALAAAALWNPVFIAIAGATGSTIGETTGYLAGVSARGAVDNFAAKHKWYGRIETMVEKRGLITITALAAIPAPGFDVVGIAAGSLRYPFHRFMIAVLGGRLVKFGAAATIGYYGAPVILGLFS